MKTLTAQQIADEMNISLSTAYRLVKDIKQEYSIKTNKITKQHLKNYLSL